MQIDNNADSWLTCIACYILIKPNRTERLHKADTDNIHNDKENCSLDKKYLVASFTTSRINIQFIS